MGGRQPPEDKKLSKAALIAATGVSERQLRRWRQEGLIPTIERPRSLGQGNGSEPIEYPLAAIATTNRHIELSQRFKKIDERRWHLWLEGHPVRIARDLADILGKLKAARAGIKTLSDIETKMIPVVLRKLRNLPRGHLLRTICRGLSEDDLRSLTTLVICIVLGIRLPMFDEPDPYPFQVFKRAFGLPKNLQMPRGLFDVFPYMHEQIINTLCTATADELKTACAVCRFLASVLDNPEKLRRGAIVVSGTPLPWRVIKFASSAWSSLLGRAATVGLIIFGIRQFKSARGEQGVAAAASIARERILWPESEG